GSVEHMNEEAGAIWMQRLLGVYERAVWLNPVPQKHWNYSSSINLVRELMEDRMYPLTLSGLDEAMSELRR
ncbi:MAG: VWA domain-containing protein, partial [Parvularculaceae bacterium]|nr:VWA domain-containing protein [Parvularculaceae bacterium]